MGRSRRATPGIDGLAIIDKEPGWTSHDVVAKARGLLGTPKVGHSGTLDPGATGVLVLGVGKATRLLKFLQGLPKSYEGEVVFGVETSTLDDEGEVTATHEMSPTIADVQAAATRFLGDIDQVPPMVSAIKIDGQRLHELARQGVEVERAARPVRIDRFDVIATDDPLVGRIAVDCSSGTYIRSLAADLGTALGGGAHLRRLRRTSVGPFDLSMARSLGQIELLPMAEALADMDRVVAPATLLPRIGVGAVLERDELGVVGDGPWGVLGPDGDVLAVYIAHRDGTVKPSVVLSS
jgi:tRNA pseudouridine55 synthase